MDISSEKRIADATAQEIAELESLKNKGYVMVPYQEFVRLTKESQNYRIIITAYQDIDNEYGVAPVLEAMLEMEGRTKLTTIRNEMDTMIKKRKDMEVRNRPAYEKGDDE